MKMIFIIGRRELKTLFLSPLAWSILAILQFILAYLFLSQVETFNSFQARLATIDNAPGLTDIVVNPLFTNAAIILLLVTPLLTMRLVCEERRNKTLSLLLSAPLNGTEIIIGKYAGILGLLLSIVGLVCLMPLSLLLGGELDVGKFFCNILALSLLIAAFASVGLYMSCIAGHPTVAAIGSFGLLLLLWVLDWSAGLKGQSSEIFNYLSMLQHFQNMQSGLLDSSDVLYFMLFSATFIILSIRRLESDRLQK
ncbi:ABC transporter permease subunit [Methylomarinum vadi]|uniref:ABC transporter permease subunit n=1 Tax=Methylomarinum vadi TaxID=438855 RepID=UPI000A624A6E|nr:ABC transporter permease subunit [Methylomarinum vadi]